jgi:hypothetical protein
MVNLAGQIQAHLCLLPSRLYLASPRQSSASVPSQVTYVIRTRLYYLWTR